ncbi:MAG: hypothetical protein IJK81_06155 [Selenomonadaceae bacterium]|nr:hypothetical protein [Selenomonadaceae bacterium]
MNGKQDYIQQKISSATSTLIGSALDNIIGDLPQDSRKEFLELLVKIEEEGIDAILEDYQKQVERTAYEYAVQLATRHTEATLKRIQQKLPRGKTRDKVFAALNEMANKGIESFCSGKTLEEVKTELAEIGKTHLKRYIEEQAHVYSKSAGKQIYMRLKFRGRGSRKTNRYLRNATDLFANELSFQITDNLGAWIDGKQDFVDAAGNIVVYTGKNTAVEYTKQHGAELAAEAIKALSERAEREIKNEMLRNGTVTVLNKLADSKTLTGVAGAVYDLSSTFKKLINGEISKAEFLRELGEKGTGAVVSGVYASLGTMIGTGIGGPLGGAIGGAIGSAVGYFANSLLYGSVLKAFEDAELARKRYETMHVFYKYYINEMERQRQEFERKVAQFLSNRQQVIDRSLNQFEYALEKRDFDSMNAALNNIAHEFGGKLPSREDIANPNYILEL